MGFPRELQLIFNDVFKQKTHYLEWELFGSASDDLRVVLTWRKNLSFIKKGQEEKLWKLRQSSVSTDDVGKELEDSDSICDSSLYNKTGDQWVKKTNDDDVFTEPKGDTQLGRKGKQDKSKHQNIWKERENLLQKQNKKDALKWETSTDRKKSKQTYNDNETNSSPGNKEKITQIKSDNIIIENNGKKDEKRSKINEDKSKVREAKNDDNKNEEKTTKTEKSMEIPDVKIKINKTAEKCEKSYEGAQKLSETACLSTEIMTKTMKDENENKTKLKKKNPFRKLRRDEKVLGRSKLQLSLSIDEEFQTEPSGTEDEDEPLVNRHLQIGDGRGSKRNSLYDEPIQEQVNEGQTDNLSERLDKSEAGVECNETVCKDKSKDLVDGNNNSTVSSDFSKTQIRSKETAKRMLELQRQKFKMSMEDSSATDNHGGNPTVQLNDGDIFVKQTNGIIETQSDDNGTKVKGKSRKKLLSKKSKRKTQVKEGCSSFVKPAQLTDKPTGWSRCVDCRYNGFCDDLTHKSEYLAIIIGDAERPQEETIKCSCNVCTGGAVHNGCGYRELRRLKNDFKLFDKRNLCLCKLCIPFKYRSMCLREELKLMRKEGNDIYYRLTYDGDDGKEGYHPPSSYGSLSESSEDEGDISSALCLTNIEIELDGEDELHFRNCMDCHFNGFCDNIRHKKLYCQLLKNDYKDFERVADTCNCLACEFKGAAHNGCANREIKRLKYDVSLFDKRNLCSCRVCVPFKYRQMCLRQELKMKLRDYGVNLYKKL